MRAFLPIVLLLGSFLSAFSQVKPDSGLVAYHPFNGNANDASGNGNNAVFNNASLTNDRFGNPNTAYSFNGVDNYIQIPNTSSGALPVTLAGFEATTTGKQIKLSWNVENVDELSSFTIERSPTGQADFIPLSKIIAGNTIHSYYFVDNPADANQIYYYRLAILEKGGAMSYSDIKTAKISAKYIAVVAYPDPSHGNFTIRINGYPGNAKLTIINPAGQVIMTKSETIIEIIPFSLIQKYTRQASIG